MKGTVLTAGKNAACSFRIVHKRKTQLFNMVSKKKPPDSFKNHRYKYKISANESPLMSCLWMHLTLWHFKWVIKPITKPVSLWLALCSQDAPLILWVKNISTISVFNWLWHCFCQVILNCTNFIFYQVLVFWTFALCCVIRQFERVQLVNFPCRWWQSLKILIKTEFRQTINDRRGL